MIRHFAPALLLFAGLSATAFAGDTVEVATPLGKTLQGEKVTNPAAGSPEAAIIASIKMLTEGKFDAWMNDACDPEYCVNDATAREQMRAYNLESAKKNAGACLQDEGTSLVITKREGDPAADTELKLYTFCGATRMPVPTSLKKHGETWRISSISW